MPHSNHKPKTFWRLGAALLIVALVVLVFSLRTNGSQSVLSKKGDIVEAVYGLGTVTANHTYQLKLGVTSMIKKLYVDEGATVEKDQALVTLDEGGTFKAPFSGVITAVPFKEKETIFAQLPIITLVDPKDRYVVVSLEQESALRARPGQIARMSFESLRGKTYEGKVRSIYPNQGQFFVRIDVSGLPEEVQPGMTGDVAIETARRHDVLLIPVTSVQAGRVVVKSGGKTNKVAVVIGAVDGRWAEVKSGAINEGDEIFLPR